MTKSGLADSPFFNLSPIPAASPSGSNVVFANHQPLKAAQPKLKPKHHRVIEPAQPPHIVKNRQTSDVTKSVSYELPKLQGYGVRKYDELRRLDIRITGEQKRFLDDWEEDIRQAMPEGDRDNPDHQRITKNSIIRVLLEVARQLKLKVDASEFRNEGDLLEAIFDELQNKVRKFRSSEVGK